jgi:hypothetical protein
MQCTAELRTTEPAHQLSMDDFKKETFGQVFPIHLTQICRDFSS